MRLPFNDKMKKTEEQGCLLKLNNESHQDSSERIVLKFKGFKVFKFQFFIENLKDHQKLTDKNED